MSSTLHHEVPIVSFDFETTDIDKHTSGIVQYGIAAQLTPDGPIKRTGGIVNCPERINPGAEKIHGISEEDKQLYGIDIEKMLDILTKSFSWAHTKGGIIVAMNMQFDWTVLTMTALRHHWKPHPHAFVQKADLYDPLVVDRKLERYRKGPKNLETLLDLYGLRDELVNADVAHEAARDAEAALLISREQLGIYEDLARIPRGNVTETMHVWHAEWADRYEEHLDKTGQQHKHIERDWPFIPVPVDPPEDDSPPFDPDHDIDDGDAPDFD